MAVLDPIIPDWDLDDGDSDVPESDDDYEFTDPDAVPVAPI